MSDETINDTEISGTGESPSASTALDDATELSSDGSANQTDGTNDGGDSSEDVDDELDEVNADTSTKPVHRLALGMGLVTIVAMTALASWLGYQAHQSHQASEQRQLYLQVARQGALNLTTIDWQHADGDVQRILDSATGRFYDDFSKRSQPFVDVVKKVKSKSVGTIAEAGLESQSREGAQVLVAISVKTALADAPDQNPRAWRMRITVRKVGSDLKISDVEFVI